MPTGTLFLEALYIESFCKNKNPLIRWTFSEPLLGSFFEFQFLSKLWTISNARIFLYNNSILKSTEHSKRVAFFFSSFILVKESVQWKRKNLAFDFR